MQRDSAGMGDNMSTRDRQRAKSWSTYSWLDLETPLREKLGLVTSRTIAAIARDESDALYWLARTARKVLAGEMGV